MVRVPIRASIFTLLLLAAMACSTSGASAARPRTNSAVLTTEELRATQHVSLLALIRSERPHWLRYAPTSVVTGQTPVIVYQDHMRMGGIDLLEMIRPGTVYSVRYFSASEAEGRFGIGHEGGVIQIRTVPGR